MKIEYKGYAIVADGTFGYKNIKSIGAGVLPKTLRGSYTGFQQAKNAIDAHVSLKGVKQDGKKTSSSGD